MSEKIEPNVGFLKVSPYGYGLVKVDTTSFRPKTAVSIRIATEDFGGAIDGDQVRITIVANRRRPVGRVAEVLARGRRRITGVVSGPPWKIVPDDPRLLLAAWIEGECPKDVQGKLVLAEIVRYPGECGDPLQVRVSRVLGNPGELPVEIARILAEREIPEAFESAVQREVEAVPQDVRLADHQGRVDLRDKAFITIDPETARDFDDAVAAEAIAGEGVRIWVAVADVSHYVVPDTAIDREANARSFSIYLPDRVIPMLPEALSSGICSLVPQRDRLAVVVRMDLDSGGRVRSSDYHVALIHSREQLSYQGVADAIAGAKSEESAQYKPYLPQIQALMRAAKGLRANRMRRGSLDLDLSERKVLLDEDDPMCVRDIVAARQHPGVRDAYNLIEELMIAANEAVGRKLNAVAAPTLWRVHQGPSGDACEELARLLRIHGVDVDSAMLGDSKQVSGLLGRLKEHPAARELSFLVLRALKQAAYRTESLGHFGLASQHYLHFTSPIRRYPDLLVHRTLKRCLQTEGSARGRFCEIDPGDIKSLGRYAEQASLCERRATEVERSVTDLYAAHFMRDRIGDRFNARVSGSAAFGAFVALERPFVEGLIKREAFPEPMGFDREREQLIGKRSGRRICLGDAIRVRLVAASVARRQIDFECVASDKERDEAAVSERKRGARRRRTFRKRGD